MLLRKLSKPSDLPPKSAKTSENRQSTIGKKKSIQKS